MTRVNTIYITTQPRSFHINVGMHLGQDYYRTKYEGQTGAGQKEKLGLYLV